MTPERLNKLLPWITVPLVLVVAVLMWFMYQGLEHVAEPLKQGSSHNTSAFAQRCQSQEPGQVNAPKAGAGPMNCVQSEESKANGALGLWLLGGALSLTIVFSLATAIPAWRNFFRRLLWGW